jgi:uncharacterized RDD family membrane protein YckC
MYCPACGTETRGNENFCTQCGASLKENNAVIISGQSHATDSSPLNIRYAGFWFRVLAAIIDGIASQLITIFVVMPLAFTAGLSLPEDTSLEAAEAIGGVIGFLAGTIIHWLWFTIPESSSWQASLGKKLLGLRVTDLNHNRISFGRANARYWSKILSTLILMIGFLMAAFTSKKQALHDLISGTLVVR